MLRRILRLLPHSSQASNKNSPVFRQRTFVAPLRPSLVVFLGVSVATFTYTTITAIHGDHDSSVQKSPYIDLLPHHIPPSPTTDEAFDLSSDSLGPKDKAAGIATGIIRMDTMLLPSNHPCEDTFDQFIVRFSRTLDYSMFGVYDGHNGSNLSEFLKEKLLSVVVTELAKLYSDHAAASRPGHTDIEGRFSFVTKDTPDGDQQLLREEQHGMIEGLYEGSPNPNPSEEEIDQSIKKTFLSLDSIIVDDFAQEVLDKPLSKEEGVKQLSLANAGSCALLGIYNNVKRTFKVALTGDSRAVLGRRVAVKEDTYAYETHVLSADQTAHNPLEVERLQAAHPDENMFEGGRVLGWGMSRAFGDAVCKWSLEIQQRLHEEYLGDKPRSICLTPPYFTAEPVITTTTIRKGDFVVMASDGLWDCLTSEEVVGLVGGWLETRGEEVKIGKDEGIGEGEMVMLPFGRGPSGQHHKKGFGKGRGIGWPNGSNGGGGNKVGKEDATTIWERTDLPVTSIKPDETQMYKWWRATKRFVNIDANSAVHLTRNALGGADGDLTGALLRLTPPRSRYYRDDICVQVIFFY